jgi:hypothetical protein
MLAGDSSRIGGGKARGLAAPDPADRHARVMAVPIYELAFLWGVGPRVGEACVDHIEGFSFSAPSEARKLKPSRSTI